MTVTPAPAAPSLANPDAQPAIPPRRRRPITLLILTGLILLKAFAIGAAVAGATFPPLRTLARTIVSADVVEIIVRTPGAEAVLGAMAILLFVTGVLLLRGRRSGWLLAMVTTGVFVAADIYGYLGNGGISHAWMALNVLTVFYLNQPEVREVVGAASIHGEDPVA